MATPCTPNTADSLRLKRSFSEITDWQETSLKFNKHSTIYEMDRSASTMTESRPEERLPAIQTQPSLLTSLPSFMSVFGGDEKMGTRQNMFSDGQLCSRTAGQTLQASQTDYLPPLPPFLHRGSESSINSGSADSSPTTTVSTLDSSSITDPSPSSSPESPIAIVPLSAFRSMAMGDSPSDETGLGHLSNLSGSTPESPAKKFRNTKNLSLNLSSLCPGSRPSHLMPTSVKTSSFLEPQQKRTLTEYPSPSFIVPPKPVRRRSNIGLTIQTPAYNTTTFAAASQSALVPPTPSISKPSGLHHVQSSPSLPIMSPAVGPAGGMQLPAVNEAKPLPMGRLPTSRSTSSLASDDSIREQQARDYRDDIYYEPPLSQEAKSPTYPQGPVCIYEPNIYLYFEPTAPEASQFDVVINVAREVRNPFVLSNPISQPTSPKSTRNTSSRSPAASEHSEPQTAISTASFKTAFDMIPTTCVQPPSPQTPRPASAKKNPEYMHFPWDHHSDIVDDMLSLCALIEDRAVRRGLRVLVHCQCGVSRSATLIVAYGLYRNPRLSVQEAYDAVKERSRWIGPNMSLIYQLSEFRTKVAQMAGEIPNTPALFSPRAATFTENPFHQCMNPAGDLAMSSIFDGMGNDPRSLASPTTFLKGKNDPRSPVHRGEAPITRSLWDVLERDVHGNLTPSEIQRTRSNEIENGERESSSFRYLREAILT
ncbi:MAG: hypothetical protein M1834_000815 [Cirrosporium novae-zelandiae]|nr:MAG: hypothetical protein M1834_000815 [Cirrosporium novae-zelandiae]